MPARSPFVVYVADPTENLEGACSGTIRNGFPTAELRRWSPELGEDQWLAVEIPKTLAEFHATDATPVIFVTERVLFWSSLEDQWPAGVGFVRFLPVRPSGAATPDLSFVWVQNPFLVTTVGTPAWSPFPPAILDAHTALFRGLDGTLRGLGKGVAAFFEECADLRATAPERLRGIWRQQDALFSVAGLDEDFLLTRWTKGDQTSRAFIAALYKASQVADDLVDERLTQLERSTKMTKLIYGLLVDIGMNAFYRQHEQLLMGAIVSSLLLWDGSNRWAASAARDTRMFGFVYREALEQLLGLVAAILGGVDWGATVTAEAHAYYHFANRDGFDAWDAEQLARKREAL